MAVIDLNADLGETVDGLPTADDEAMFAVISSASIACGGHAGDAASVAAAIGRASRFGVSIGAHPSYPDPVGFGRTAMSLPADALRATLDEQLDRLRTAGADIRYVKPHGALYNRIVADREQALVVADAVAALADAVGRAVPVLGLGGAIAAAAADRGLPFVREAFLDRGYLPDGTLVPRGQPGDLLHDPDVVAARAVRLAREREVVAVNGAILTADAASLCVHGDTPAAVAMARAVRRALTEAGVEVRAPW